MSVVELRDVSFVRDGRPILQDIDWSIRKGEQWALLGANGSGKTTLLKILAGYEWPTRGSVTLLGEHYGDVDLRKLRRSIGLVSTAIEQRIPARDSALEVAASGFEASLGLYRELIEAEWDEAGRALDMVNGNSFAEQPFKTLSQGEQQRAIIARALVNRPAVLILDEPCAGLDPAARQAFLEDIQTLATGSHAPSIVFVTHHIEEIGPWVTHCHVLRGGCSLAKGSVGDTLTADVMSRAFGRSCEVERVGDWRRLSLNVESRPRK